MRTRMNLWWTTSSNAELTIEATIHEDNSTSRNNTDLIIIVTKGKVSKDVFIL